MPVPEQALNTGRDLGQAQRLSRHLGQAQRHVPACHPKDPSGAMQWFTSQIAYLVQLRLPLQ